MLHNPYAIKPYSTLITLYLPTLLVWFMVYSTPYPLIFVMLMCGFECRLNGNIVYSEDAFFYSFTKPLLWYV